MTLTNKPILIIDTNVLLAIIGSKSGYHSIWKSFINEEFFICVSTEILLEYEEQLVTRYSELFSGITLNLLAEAPNVLQISTPFTWNLITTDPDDNKFVDAAIAGKADYIVTHDKHFEVLKKISFPKVHTITTTELLQLLNITY
jgi:uncharacterized protein